YFFFSSRRRHTRCLSDWSSDVCSSDLFLGQPAAPGISVGSFQVAYNDANWDSKGFDIDRDLKVVDEKVGSVINAVNPDLSAFKRSEERRVGKEWRCRRVVYQ